MRSRDAAIHAPRGLGIFIKNICNQHRQRSDCACTDIQTHPIRHTQLVMFFPAVWIIASSLNTPSFRTTRHKPKHDSEATISPSRRLMGPKPVGWSNPPLPDRYVHTENSHGVANQALTHPRLRVLQTAQHPPDGISHQTTYARSPTKLIEANHSPCHRHSSDHSNGVDTEPCSLHSIRQRRQRLPHTTSHTDCRSIICAACSRGHQRHRYLCTRFFEQRPI